MSKKIRWSVTENHINIENDLSKKIRALVFSIIELENKISLLTDNETLSKKLNDVLDTQEKLHKEFIESSYKITPKTEIIFGNIPLMN